MAGLYPILIGIVMFLFIGITGVIWKYILNLKGSAYLIYGITPVLLPLLIVTVICNFFGVNTDVYFWLMFLVVIAEVIINIVGFVLYKQELLYLFRKFELRKYLSQNWLTLITVVVALIISFFSMSRTVYGLSNTDDTTYLGIQTIMNATGAMSGIAPTSGLAYDTSNLGYMLMVSLQWSQMEWFLARFFGIEVILFSRVSMAVFTICLSVFILKPIGKNLLGENKAQYIYCMVLALFIWPFFSGSDPWSQIVRLLYMPWFGSAMYVIIIPAMMLYWLLKIIERKSFRKEDIVFGILFLPIAVFIHSIGATFALEFMAAAVILLIIWRFNKIRPIWLIGALFVALVIASGINIMQYGWEDFVLLRHKELVLLWKDLLQPIMIFLYLVGSLLVFLVYKKDPKSKIVYSYILLCGLVIFTMLACIGADILGIGIFPLFGYRRMIDSYIILLLIVMLSAFFALLQNKKQFSFAAIMIIILCIALEIIYPNNLISAYDESKKTEFTSFLKNPAKIHPLSQDIADYFNLEDPNALIYGVRYIYTPETSDMLVLTDSVHLLAGGTTVYSNIRDYDENVYGTINLDNNQLLQNAMSCFEEICLQSDFDAENMAMQIKDFMIANNIGYLIMPELMDKGLPHPVYEALIELGFESKKEFAGYDLATPIHLLVLSDEYVN